MGVEANKRNRFNLLRSRLHLHARAMGGHGIATFFTSLHRAAPEISESVVACRQRVVTISLSKIQRAIVAQSLEKRLDAPLGVVRRALGATVEKDVKLDPQAADIVFQTR